MAEPIIDLSTVAPERVEIRIDGESHDLMNNDDFGLEARRELNKSWSRILEIEQKEKVTKTDDTEYNQHVTKLALMVLPTAKSKLRRAPRSVQEAVVLAFFGEQTDPRTMVGMGRLRRLIEAQKAVESTGATSSLNSNGSTVGTPNVGG